MFWEQFIQKRERIEVVGHASVEKAVSDEVKYRKLTCRTILSRHRNRHTVGAGQIPPAPGVPAGSAYLPLQGDRQGFFSLCGKNMAIFIVRLIFGTFWATVFFCGSRSVIVRARVLSCEGPCEKSLQSGAVPEISRGGGNFHFFFW